MIFALSCILKYPIKYLMEKSHLTLMKWSIFKKNKFSVFLLCIHIYSARPGIFFIIWIFLSGVLFVNIQPMQPHRKNMLKTKLFCVCVFHECFLVVQKQFKIAFSNCWNQWKTKRKYDEIVMKYGEREFSCE